jgi:hypothetical protein
MSSKTAKPAPNAIANAAAPWNFLADLGRQQMAVVNDASCAMLRGFETMRQIQHDAAHHAAAQHQAAAQRLHSSCAPADVMAIQSELLSDDFQAASQYWQQLAGAAMEMQTEMMGCATHLLDSETALEAASAMESFDALPGFNTFFARKMNGSAEKARV